MRPIKEANRSKLLIAGMCLWAVTLLAAYGMGMIVRHAAPEKADYVLDAGGAPGQQSALIEQAVLSGLCCESVDCSLKGENDVQSLTVRGALSQPASLGAAPARRTVAPALLEEFGRAGGLRD